MVVQDLIVSIGAFVIITMVSFLIFILKKSITDRDKKIDNMEKKIAKSLEKGDDRMSNIENDIHTIKEDLPKEYVLKEEYRRDIYDIKQGITRIESFIMEDKK